MDGITIIKLKDIKNTTDWELALKYAWDLAIITSPSSLNELTPQDIKASEKCKKEVVIADSAYFLQEKGCNPTIENGKVIISEDEMRKIATGIESNILLLGGIKTLEFLFKSIQQYYNFEQHRYFIGRYFHALEEINFPSLPVGYILNLAVKKPESGLLSSETPEKIWEKIKEESIVLSSILDVQTINVFELWFHDKETIISHIKNLALYDTLYCPTQMRFSDVTKIISGIFSILSEEMTQHLGWNPDQAVKIVENIFELTEVTRNTVYPVKFNSEDLYQLTPEIEKDVIDKLLNIYSHPSNSVNTNFLIPSDIPTIDGDKFFQHKPLIQLNRQEYLFVNPSFCSSAFYESIRAAIRKNSILEEQIKKLDFGILIEEFVKAQFTDRGVTFSCGDYGPKGREDEVDIVVEASDALIFFEVKAKPLTRVSRCGDEVELFIDLFQSLVQSQTQINKHEIHLRKNGFLSLDDGSCCHFDNKKIIKVSLSLLDFGSFQDKTFLTNFLSILVNSNLQIFHSNRRRTAKKSNELNEELNNDCMKLTSQLDALNTLNPDFKKCDPFFNSWFLSIPQLLIILDNVNSNDDLKKEIYKTRNLSIGSSDFYREYAEARKYKSD
ncbi:MAG: hypothetical protein ACRCU2_13510 [Planktothrix sp.]